MKQVAASKIVNLSTFRNLFRGTVKTIAYMSPSSGRPKKTVLGDERFQMTRAGSARIVNALVEEMERKAQIFEPACRFLYDVTKRVAWSATQVNNMSTTKRQAVDPDPFKQVEAMCGDLITIAMRKGEDGSREAVRITTAGATHVELRIFADRNWKKGRRENELSTRLAKAVNKVADAMAEGETFEQAKARHYSNIGRGGPDEFKKDDGDSK